MLGGRRESNNLIKKVSNKTAKSNNHDTSNHDTLARSLRSDKSSKRV